MPLGSSSVDGFGNLAGQAEEGGRDKETGGGTDAGRHREVVGGVHTVAGLRKGAAGSSLHTGPAAVGAAAAGMPMNAVAAETTATAAVAGMMAGVAADGMTAKAASAVGMTGKADAAGPGRSGQWARRLVAKAAGKISEVPCPST